VLGYRRKDLSTRRVLDTTALDLPERILRTQASWYSFDPDILTETAESWLELPGILHAAEHTAIAVLPLFAVCDRWDIGGLSTALHQQLGEPVFFIYDGYPGGAGIAPIAYDRADRHLAATLAVLEECSCRDGCPSCVQSPKCGNFNEPLDRHGAARLLRLALDP
jgi:DEAD/DEAH box helicase domain-containing protein